MCNGDLLRCALEQKTCAGNHEQDACDLRPLQNSPEQRAATDGVAPELGDEQYGAGRHQEDAGEIAMLAAMRQPKEKANCNREKAERGVGLHRMNRNAERGIAPSRSQW